MEKNKKDLLNLYLKGKYNYNDYGECIDWALDNLDNCNYDDNICILAGLNKSETREIEKYIELIIGEKLYEYESEIEFIAGKILVNLYKSYIRKELSIIEVEKEIYKMTCKLDYPVWIIMLARNSEYATDVIDFIEPFENEFEYIANLWEKSNSLQEFLKKYSKEVSSRNSM